jgi:adenosylmethionine-8-amino-7-oxononanoate aminotransferase
MDLIFSSSLLEKLPAKVELIRRRLVELAGHTSVADIRQCGMMVGVELMAEPQSKTPFDPLRRVGAAVCKHARRHSIIIRPIGDVVVLMPAPAMDEKTLERLLQGVIATIQEYFDRAV